MSAELEPVAVLADRLQADGDPRGELLALELAAALADSTEDSRRLCLAAAALRSANLELAWPSALSTQRGLIRAGLLVAGMWSPRSPEMLASLGPTCRELVIAKRRDGLGLRALHDARMRTQLRLDGLWEQRTLTGNKTVELGLGPDQSLELTSLGLTRPVFNPAVLRQLHGLTHLDMGSVRLWPDLLDQLPALALRSLTVALTEREQLQPLLDACPQLEHLTLSNFEHSLESLAGLERLRSLTLLDLPLGTPSGDKLPVAHSLRNLESLFVSRPSLDDIERIAELRLRRLIVFAAVEDRDAIVAAVAKLDSLEHLGLLWPPGRRVDMAPLSALSRLRTLELGDCSGELHAPASLERVVLRWSTRMRIHGVVPTLHCGSDLFVVRDNIDLSRTTTFGFSAGGSRQKLGPETLASVETLDIDGAGVQPEWLTWIEQLPRLRTVIWPNLSIRQQRAASERLPHLQIIGADAPRLRHAWPKPNDFDLLAPRNWPKCINYR